MIYVPADRVPDGSKLRLFQGFDATDDGRGLFLVGCVLGEARPPIHGRAKVLRQKTELGSDAKCGACCQALLCTCVYSLCASTLMCACAGARDRIGPRASPSEHRALTMPNDKCGTVLEATETVCRSVRNQYNSY